MKVRIKEQTLDFYFDYLSPFAYFAWLKVQDFCRQHELELKPHPVVFGKLLDHWGQLGPAEVPPKNAWLVKYCYRYGQQHGFEVVGPKYHPFNSLNAMRLSLKEVCGDDQVKIITAIFEAGWTHGRDIGDLSELLNIIDELGINSDKLAEQISKVAIKDILKQETSDAIALGVFGVPTMVIGDELFWGNDQFDFMGQYVQGEDTIDFEKLTTALARERAIDRKSIK